MDASIQEGEGKNKITEVITFPIPYAEVVFKENLSINTSTSFEKSKELIINQAIGFHLKGNIPETTKYYQNLINQGC